MDTTSSCLKTEGPFLTGFPLRCLKTSSNDLQQTEASKQALQLPEDMLVISGPSSCFVGLGTEPWGQR